MQPSSSTEYEDFAQKFAVALGPVTLPAELNRKQLVTRDTGNRVKLAEFHRWAGPLQDNITSVLTANLAARLGIQRIAPYNQKSLFPFTHHVIFSINRFDSWPANEIILNVTWSIKKTGVSEPLFVQRCEIRKQVATPDYTGMITAQSKALADISSQIAKVITNLLQNR